MSRDLKVIQSVPTTDAPRPCAFYQAAMPTASHLRRSAMEKEASAGGLNHRCMLNPGRTCGPDGENIGPLICTLARQGGCQAHRRKNIARLYESLPIPRAADAPQA
jgi:hypothetical protein